MSNVKGMQGKLQQNDKAINNNPEYRVKVFDAHGSYHYTISARSEFEAKQIATRKAGLKESDVINIEVNVQKGKSLCRPTLSILQTMDQAGRVLKFAAGV
jgi:hypothetical protein